MVAERGLEPPDLRVMSGNSVNFLRQSTQIYTNIMQSVTAPLSSLHHSVAICVNTDEGKQEGNRKISIYIK